jgi:26S proteasome regulatory subunit N12
MSSLDTAKTLLSELSAKCDAGDIVGGRETLNKLKICMLEFPPSSSSGDANTVATQALELGVLLMVADGDLDAFARNVAQLKPYYDAAVAVESSSAPRKCHILGLNLMHLLVDNRLSEFHAELELLSDAEASHPFVTFPIDLERQLMVGMYDKVLNVSVPDPSYQFFVDHLLQTVRDSIADCVEVSYKQMKLQDALVLMKFTTPKELLDYVEECRDDWIIQDDQLCFQPPPSGSKASDVPSMKLIAQTLSYATELERIV